MSRLLVSIFLSFWACIGVAAQEFSGLARVNPVGSAVTADWRGRVDFQLALTQGVPFRVYTLTDPARLVLDFQEVHWTGLDPVAFVQTERVGALRMGPYRPGWSRLVAELTEPMVVNTAAMQVDESSGAAQVSVQLAAATPAEMAAKSGAPNDPRWALPSPKKPRPKARADDVMTIVIDPGHGGIDPGAEVDGVDEASLMLTVALELKDALLRAGGFEVVLTRHADEFVSLERRVAIAHERAGDVFVSLHADALREGAAYGATVYTLSETASDAASAALAERHDRDDLLSGVDLTGKDDVVADVLMDLARMENTPRSEQLARGIVLGIENAVGQVHKRPLRSAGFSVLKAADIPSVLIELGFLTSRADLQRLSDPIWRAGMVAGIRDGIQAWAITDAANAPLRRR